MTPPHDPEDLPRSLERKIGPVLRALRNAALPAWAVGGVLRDFLMHRPFRDIDLLVRSSPDTLASVLPHGVWVGKVIPAFVLSSGRRSRRPTVQITVFSGSIAEELSRRDFSINALAMSMGDDPGQRGKILDYFGGVGDIDRGVLRRPSSGRDPFSEDPVRVIRLVRFSATLGFSVEPDTLALARQSVGGLSSISGERRRQELIALFSGPDLARLSMIFPEEFLWEALTRAAGTPGEGPLTPGTLARVLRDTSRWSRRDPLFRMWFLWHRMKTDDLKAGLPFSRAEGRRIRRFGRLVRFFGNVADNGPQTLSDRGLLLDPDRRETVRRMVEQGLPPEARARYKKVSRKIVSELCRPWEEVREGILGKKRCED